MAEETRICTKCGEETTMDAADGEGNALCWGCHVDTEFPDAEPMPAGWLEPDHPMWDGMRLHG